MAFLMKIAELQKHLNRALICMDEAVNLFDKEGIGQKKLKETLTRGSEEIKNVSGEIARFLQNKQSKIEEIEFLTEAFRMEYGTILHYRKYAALIENKELAQRLIKFGKMETKHANELIKLIYKRGGTPEYSFDEEKPEKNQNKEDIIKVLVDEEKRTIAFYEEGLDSFRDADFAWLIGNIKVDEAEHLKELGKLAKEFENKEICLKHDPNFKWIDPYMGEPGDRAWIE